MWRVKPSSVLTNTYARQMDWILWRVIRKAAKAFSVFFQCRVKTPEGLQMPGKNLCKRCLLWLCNAPMFSTCTNCRSSHRQKIHAFFSSESGFAGEFTRKMKKSRLFAGLNRTFGSDWGWSRNWSSWTWTPPDQGSGRAGWGHWIARFWCGKDMHPQPLVDFRVSILFWQ